MLDWIETHIPPWVYIGIIAHFAVLGTVAYLILLERKVASWVQDRIGPNRVGLGFGIVPFLKDKKMFGLGQPLADGIKFVVKEDYKPRNVDKVLFTLAPAIMIITVIISIAVLPWGGVKQGTKQVVLGPADEVSQLSPAQLVDRAQAALPSWYHVEGTPVVDSTADGILRDGTVYSATAEGQPVHYALSTVIYRWTFQIADLNIGVLFVLATLSLAVYGVVIGGWASNNKYSFLGGLRATANMISYEVPLGLSVLAIVVMFGTLDLNVLVDKQCHYWLGFIPAWNVFTQPLAFLMFLICIHAEANRAPFDMAEAEQELVGGYHTEYSAMRFALFFLAEYAGMITTSAVCVALFFGGWHLPWIEWLWPGLRGNVDPGSHAVTTSLVACIVRAGIFFGKTLAVIFIFMWTRWSLPRFRFDQLMNLAWRALIPISLAQVMVTAIVVYVTRDWDHAYDRISGHAGAAYLLANVVLLVLTMLASKILPAGAPTNRKIDIPNSRFVKTPMRGTPVGALSLNTAAVARLAVDPMPLTSGRMGS